MSDIKPSTSANDPDIEFDETLDSARPPGSTCADERFVKQGGLLASPVGTNATSTLSQERAAFYSAHPYSEFCKSLKKRTGSPTTQPSVFQRLWWQIRETLNARLPKGAFVGATAALLLAAGAPLLFKNTAPSSVPATPSTEDGIRPKGKVIPNTAPTIANTPTVELRATLRTIGMARPVQSGEMLRKGDQLRLSYDSDGLSYILVVSVDDTGVVSPLYPDDRSQSIEIVPGVNIPLAGGIELDGFVGAERIFALFSNRPVRFEDVSYAVEELPTEPSTGKIDLVRIDKLPMSEGIAQSSLWFRKVAE